MKLSGKKTYLTSLGTILGAVGGFLTGNLELAEAINLVVAAILASTIRHGVSTESQNENQG